MIRCPQCYMCEHFFGEKEACEAYPDGIPEDVVMESIFYDEGYKCSEKIFYNRKKDKC